MRSRVLIGLLSLVAFLGVFMGAPAAADTRPPDGEAFVDEEGNPTVEVGDGDDGESGDDGSSSGGDPCVWEVVIADDFASHVYDVDGTVQYSETGRWLQKVCPGVGAVMVGGQFLIPEGGLVDVEALALQARASIGISGPVIRTSPEAGGRLYVRVPTWLWVDGGWWHSYSATASAGRVTATVSAQPVSASWAFGDGGSVACSGPGVAWRAGLSEDATDCSHTFTTSSAGQPDGRFSLSATVTLEITWTSNIGSGGTLSPISRSSSQAVEVGEIQAIGSGG
jgi:hypothetical protein